MKRDQPPTDCCNHNCNQGRTCPAKKLHTKPGGKRIDTESLFDWADALIQGARWMALGIAVACVTLAFIYFLK